jgi:predicted DsbA family dithiol-disulfide isomerase
MAELSVDVWSDIACPWCFVGKRRLEKATAQFTSAHPDVSVHVSWHAFQLDPSAPQSYPQEPNYAQRLANKYRRTLEQAQGMLNDMTRTGAAENISFRFEQVQGCNTFDAHRLLQFAAQRGKQGVLKERLLVAYMTEGRLLSDISTLVALAAEVGLDPDEVSSVLQSDQYASEVREERAEAAALGIHGVPFFVVDGRFAVEGAQPAAHIAQVLQHAWSTSDAAQRDSAAQGENPAQNETASGVCTADGCA